MFHINMTYILDVCDRKPLSMFLSIDVLFMLTTRQPGHQTLKRIPIHGVVLHVAFFAIYFYLVPVGVCVVRV